MRKYEIMFIVRPDLEEKAVKETVKKTAEKSTTSKGAKFCTNCGAELTGGKFCSKCGHEIH